MIYDYKKTCVWDILPNSLWDYVLIEARPYLVPGETVVEFQSHVHTSSRGCPRVLGSLSWKKSTQISNLNSLSEHKSSFRQLDSPVCKYLFHGYSRSNIPKNVQYMLFYVLFVCVKLGMHAISWYHKCFAHIHSSD